MSNLILFLSITQDSNYQFLFTSNYSTLHVNFFLSIIQYYKSYSFTFQFLMSINQETNFLYPLRTCRLIPKLQNSPTKLQAQELSAQQPRD